MSIISVKDLTVGYEQKKVVEGMNLDVLKGQFVCLMGPNGSGKSTILKTLSALLAPISGTVRIEGTELPRIKRKVLSKMLAVVLTERFSAGFLNAFEITAMGRHPHTGFLGGMSEKDRNVVWECLRMVHAEELATRMFSQLSDGEKQKILLARALAQEPELIILDEPTTHLDIRHKLEVISILKNLSRKKGITVIVSLHEIDLALKSCDVAILVKEGRISGIGSPEIIGGSEAICRLFNMECASYNALMGSVELLNDDVPSAFIVGGGGKATGLYRLLTRNSIGFSTGVLHENDVDYHIVQSMGVKAVKEKAFEPIGDKVFRQAQELAGQVTLVIDSGFPVSEINRANQKLVLEAVAHGKQVCSLRNETESKRLYGKWSGNLIHCRTPEEILEYCRMAAGGECGAGARTWDKNREYLPEDKSLCRRKSD